MATQAELLAEIQRLSAQLEKAEDELRFVLRRPVPTPGGLVGHGYTVTHYVNTSAVVGVSDTTDQGSTAYANATTLGNAVSAATAFRWATAGHVVEFQPGTYTGAGGTGFSGGAFQVSNAGTSGSRITFTAKYPATHNATSRTKFRNTNNAPPASGAPVICAFSYVTLDGFWFDYADGGLPSTRGVVATSPIGASQMYGVHFRRLRFDRTDLGGNDDGDNFGCVHLWGNRNSVVSDCIFSGGHASAGGSENEACIETYGAWNITIQHCTFENVKTAFYIKGSNADWANSGVLQYCKIKNAYDAIRLNSGPLAAQSGEVFEVKQNLIYHDGVQDYASGVHFMGFTNNLNDFIVHHNTSVGLQSEGAPVFRSQWGTLQTGNEFRDNIACVLAGDSAEPIVNWQHASGFGDFDVMNYNLYYNAGSTPDFYYGSFRNGLAAWQSATGMDANSQVANPNFANAGAENYRLTTGAALTASSTGGPVGCYITGTEEIGVRSAPTY